MISRVVESRAELAACRQVIPGTAIQVCLLGASQDTLRRRVTSRETGSPAESLAGRARELAESLSAGDVPDFVVDTEGRRLPDIALEVLERAHWLDTVPEQLP